ncbi:MULTISPECIES: hypothetical protein [unclassified Brenneria]|uniref:hypothetical protein n=1 Tax=unclassified Brenneria TaxID=2634434 RepID=UPI0029C26927|nr:MULTISPECIES: hypothetical protein [unclassified Brenneria]MDX5631116.1 hypothetical protein [Brenneria sp. L3-3Z]MDX5698189.1 hypothetical protein [Brenneria sp. L4-2C]
MVTTLDVRTFINSDNYLNLLNNVTQSLSIPLRDSEIPSQVFNIDANCINKANTDFSILNELCSSDKEEIVNFIKLHKYEINRDNEEGDDEIVEILPSYKNFLIGYLLKYFFVSRKPEMLESYLKSLKLPAYKKHADELREIYNKI